MNTKFSLKTVAVVAAVTLASGCSIHQKIDSHENQVADVDSSISALMGSAPRYERVTISSKFWVPSLSAEESKMPDWWFTKVDSSWSAVPFSLIVNGLLAGKPITAKFSELTPADQNAVVSIEFNGMRLGEALGALADAAGYALAVGGDSVTFNKYQEKTFSIATLPGEYSSQIGNDGELSLSSGASESSATTSASMDAGNRQFSSLVVQDKVLITELKEAIEALKTKEGTVEVSELTMSVFVKDRPATVQAISRVIEKFNEELTKTIEFEITLLDVIYKQNFRQGFDYKLAGKFFGGDANLSSTGDAFIAGSGATPTPKRFDLKLIGGDFDGTQLFIDALQQQADISRTITVPVSVANGTQSKVMSVDNEMFVAEQYGNNATTGGVLTGGGARQETLQTGQIFNLAARAVGDDIAFKLNTSISSKLDIKKKSDEAAGLYLESPQTTAMIIDQTMTLESGVTKVITGLNAHNINVTNSNAGYDILGFFRSSEILRKETILIVKAKITRGLEISR